MAGINACGYDQEMQGSDPLRAEIRSEADATRVYPARITRIGEVFGPSKLAENSQELTDARDVECILDVDGVPLRVGERVQVRILGTPL